MTCNSCKNKLNGLDKENKIISVEFVNQHDLETTLSLYKMGYRLADK